MELSLLLSLFFLLFLWGDDTARGWDSCSLSSNSRSRSLGHHLVTVLIFKLTLIGSPTVYCFLSYSYSTICKYFKTGTGTEMCKWRTLLYSYESMGVSKLWFTSKFSINLTKFFWSIELSTYCKIILSASKFNSNPFKNLIVLYTAKPFRSNVNLLTMTSLIKYQYLTDLMRSNWCIISWETYSSHSSCKLV